MRSRSSGFTMIEVLVAMLVIGTGALATVMLQLHALRSSRDNSLHAAATAMALELGELRASYGAGNDGADPYLFEIEPGRAAVPALAADCSGPACDAETFAQAAVADWSARLVRDFPHARAVACRDGRADAQADWRCDHDPTAPVTLKLGWRTASSSAPADTPLLTLAIGR